MSILPGRIDWETTAQLREDVTALLTKFPNANTFLNNFVEKFDDLCNRKNCPCPSKSICHPFIHAATALYKAEGLSTPPAPFSPAIIDTHEGARYRDELLALHHKASHPDTTLDAVNWTLINSFLGLMDELPTLAFHESEDSPTTVSLVEIINVPQAITKVSAPFLNSDLRLIGIFSGIRDQLLRNQLEASKDNPKKLISPQDYDGTPREKVHAYLKHTPLETIFDARIPFDIPEQARFEHHWIVAGTGHGKTQTLQALICRDLEAVANDAASIVVIDSQGDLIKNVAGLKVFAEGQPLDGKLVLIDPTDIEFPVQLNLFSLGTERFDEYSKLDRERLLNSVIELYDFVLAALLGAEMTSKQSIIFRFVTRALLHIPNATVHTLLELMEPGGDQKYQESISKLQGAARSFFANEFNSSQFAETKRQVLRRLYGVLENQTFERMFSHPKNKLDIFKEMNSGKVILINAAKDLLKQNGTEVFGRFFIALIAQAAAERATLKPSQRLPTFVYIDECQDYIANDSNFTGILEQARKQKVGLVIAHQYLTQLSQGILDSLHANTSIKFAGGVSDRDAHALNRNMRTTPEFIERQPKGSFAAYVRNFTPNAVSLRIPFLQLEDQEQMTPKEAATVRNHMRAQYAVSFAEAQQNTSEPASPPRDPEEFADRY